MIQITKKPRRIPDKLRTDGVTQTKLNCKAYNSDKVSYISVGNKAPLKKFEGDNKIYGCLKTVKPILLTAQNWKCCYCQKDYTSANLQVEHYHPQTRVRQAKGEKYLYPGYYWLIYSWSNLFLSCRDCNGPANKSGLFPLVDPNTRVRKHTDKHKISQEQPLLIKPDEDPRPHIRFNIYGQPYPQPGSLKGKKTIEDLGLLRDDLIKDRIKKLINLLSYKVTVELFESQPENEGLEKAAALASKRIEEFRADGAEFSAMINDVLDQNFDTKDHLAKLEVILKTKDFDRFRKF